MEIEVFGYRDAGTALSDHIAAEIRAWGGQHRHRTVRFEIPPTGTSDPQTGRLLLDRPHRGLAITWR